MAAIRDLLKHVDVEIAAGQRKCKRKKTRKILKGEACLVVKTGPMNSPQSYCVENAKPMLDKAWSKLYDLYCL